jgi:SRSO17 transposase
VDDAAVLRVAGDTARAALERHGPRAAWTVDEIGIPKKRRRSVGVAR